MIEDVLKQDFPFLKQELDKILDVEVSEDGKSVTGRVLCKNNFVYSFWIDQDTVTPVMQRFM
jgi:hypothetical protein